MRLVQCASTLLFMLATAPAFAQPPGPPPGFPPPPAGGAGVFQRVCAQCHASPAADSRAPNPGALATFAPDAIVNALTNGSMRIQAEKLTPDERVQVAEFLTGRTVGAPSDASVGQCASSAAMSRPNSGSSWNGWGAGVANTRFQPAKQGGLTASDVPKLTLKWAFGFPGVLSARAQPAVTGGRLFTASETGTVYALDARTGCTYWTFRAQAGVRSAPNVGPYKSASGATRYAVYFGDSRANAYAVDADTGQQIWTRKMDDHPGAVVTGAPTLYDGRLYVPVAGIGEEGAGARPDYECCTFRGSLVALDATTGAVVWKTYSISEEPKPRGKTKEGVQTYRTGGRRHLGRAHDRSQAQCDLHRDRQRLRRSAPADDGRRDRARFEDRQDQVGESSPARRRLDDGMPAGKSGQPEMSGQAGPRLRLFRLAAADQERQGPRSDRAAAEVGHGLCPRS